MKRNMASDNIGYIIKLISNYKGVGRGKYRDEGGTLKHKQLLEGGSEGFPDLSFSSSLQSKLPASIHEKSNLEKQKGGRLLWLNKNLTFLPSLNALAPGQMSFKTPVSLFGALIKWPTAKGYFGRHRDQRSPPSILSCCESDQTEIGLSAHGQQPHLQQWPLPGAPLVTLSPIQSSEGSSRTRCRAARGFHWRWREVKEANGYSSRRGAEKAGFCSWLCF